MMIDETHDPARTSWVESANGHVDFPIQNLPLGIFSPAGGAARTGVAIGDSILDLGEIAFAMPDAVRPALAHSTLNALFALPSAERIALRRRLSALLSETPNRSAIEPSLHASSDCLLHLPTAIGDYTDFYVGIHHAMNVGRQFRPDHPLLPNYKHVPIGYHGRASSIRPSGIPVVRPRGQHKSSADDTPVFGPSTRLDYELELGVWIGQGNALGHPIALADVPKHVAGFCLLNDWSARDFQAWEYQPLGPFLAKNFHSTVSPWVISLEAMAPFRRAQPRRPVGDPPPLPYLWHEDDQSHGALAIDLEVTLSTALMRSHGIPPYQLSHAHASNMYWTVGQMIAHHSSNGCNLNPGDLLGTGTISAPTRDGVGSMLELTIGGSQPVALPSGEIRSFLEDGDEISLRATAQAEDRVSIGFGECCAAILPSPWC
jgi:fumarylacetoacetase